MKYYVFIREAIQLSAIILFLACLMTGHWFWVLGLGIFLAVWFSVKYFLKPWV